MKRSIRVRLIVSVLALLVPVSAAAGWLLIQTFGNRLLHDIDVALAEEAETVSELLATPAGSDAVLDLMSHIAGEGDHGPIKYVTVTRQGQLIAEAPRGAEAVLGSNDPTMRVVRYESRGQPITVTIGVSAAEAVHAKKRLMSLLAVGAPLALVVFGAALWLVIGRALRPLERAAQQLDDIVGETPFARITIDNAEDEVGRMVTVLNRMLDRLERVVAGLRRFTADAAHELRTPLTVLRTGLEVALARQRSAADCRAALTEALAGTDRLCRLAEDLLTLARLEAGSAPHGAGLVDLGEILHELADATDAAALHGLTIGVSAPSGLCVRGNAGDLYRLFNNLIENAIRHGGSGGQITLAAQRTGASVEVTVADRGPGIAPAELPRIFDRFYRGNGARTDDSGAGLGLSIALEIARMHGGHISAGNGAGGGCALTVTLPAVDPRPVHAH